jgi:transcriptional regulator with XRE-family HTH domain
MKDEQKKIIAQNIKKYRRAKGITGFDLSRLIGKHIKYISNVESGRHTVSADILIALCDVLGVDINNLTK